MNYYEFRVVVLHATRTMEYVIKSNEDFVVSGDLISILDTEGLRHIFSIHTLVHLTRKTGTAS